ncbi:MAG TPA: hypothetical protein VGI58_18435 [Streptosporangiaceae bacterium]
MDLLICGTAAHRDIAILHDDDDLKAAARFLPGVCERSVYDMPT